MTEIVDLEDPRVTEYQHVANAAALTAAGLFVAEGRLVVARLLTSRRFRAKSVLATRPAYDALDSVLRTLDASPPVHVVPQAAMNAVVGFNIHRGCLALGFRAPVDAPTLETMCHARRLVVLEGVNNPDNVGGIFRSAAALGVDGIVLGPGCSDPLYRKAIRTSMAATLHIPFAVTHDWPGALNGLHAAGFQVIALTPQASRTLESLDRGTGRLALLVGAEGDGLSDAALAMADDRVAITMAGGTDSLNVTVAAAIALHHLR